MRRGLIAAFVLVALLLFAGGVAPAHHRPGHKPSPSPSPTVSPSPSPSPSPTPPPTGNVIVNPVIDCNANPVGTTGTQAGLVINQSNTTVINPSIRECGHGIRVQKANGVMPTNVRIIADAAYPGYAQTNFTLNRSAIEWKAGNGEIGDVSAPADSVGGALRFVDNYRAFSGNLTSGLRIHHTHSTCAIPCPTYSGSNAPGMMWGIKFIADRPLGAPFEASHIRIDHNFVQGFEEEGISFDARGGTASQRLSIAMESVSGKGVGTLTIPNVPAEPVVGMFVRPNVGAAKGETFKITARSSNVFTVNGDISGVAVGDSVTVGGRYFDNLIDHNTLDAFHAVSAKSGFNTGHLLYSRVADNLVYDTPHFAYPARFNLRTDNQCIMIRSTHVGGISDLSLYNSIVGNTCRDAGDISMVTLAEVPAAFTMPTWTSGNTFTGSPLGQEWRYHAPEAASDPTG